MLIIILNRLNPITENILTEEQAGFIKKKNTIQHILICKIMTEKYIEIGIKVYHNFVDFKTAFDQVWYEGL